MIADIYPWIYGWCFVLWVSIFRCWFIFNYLFAPKINILYQRFIWWFL